MDYPLLEELNRLGEIGRIKFLLSLNFQVLFKGRNDLIFLFHCHLVLRLLCFQ